MTRIHKGIAMSMQTPARKAFVLGMLLIVYTFNFIDRQILGILAGSIKTDLALTDTQLGLLGGLALAILYSTLGVPLGWLADRTSRSWVVTASLALWSGFTALSGMATGFTQLFLCRLGVGFGEAGGVAPSYALIGDTFPARQRARALAVYSLGIPLGSGLGVLFGGYIAATIDWRTAFLAVGIAGLVFAPIFGLAVRDPARVKTATASPASGFGDVARPVRQAQLLAALLRCGLQLDARLWSRFLAAFADAPLVRSRSARDIALLRRIVPDRRNGRGAGGRLAG
jgi:MFS family permease